MLNKLISTLTFSFIILTGTYGGILSESNQNSKTIGILLHLHNLNYMDEFISKINTFIIKNQSFSYFIKINIPVDKNIREYTQYHLKNTTQNNQLIYREILNHTPYHSQLINVSNTRYLKYIMQYLYDKLNLEKKDIQIIFSKNRGMDIGGFFLLLDQVIKEDRKHNYLIKLHTKTNNLREKLTSFLKLPMEKYLKKYDCIYASPYHFDFSKPQPAQELGMKPEDWPWISHWHKINVANMKKLLAHYQLPQQNFDFCGGTMFLVSSKLTDFFKSYNLLEIFNSLNMGYINCDGEIEHVYERFFGYLNKYLNLTVYQITHK